MNNNLDQLLDYNEEPMELAEALASNQDVVNVPQQFSSIHTSGFRDFMLRPELMHAIQECGFEHPSEVQHECIPQAILGMDIICQAKSGMGKTAIFVLASLQQLEPYNGNVSILVLAHTRELAFQISKEYERFSKYMSDVKIAVFFGGLPVRENTDILKDEKPNIVIGTPGRILSLVKSHSLDLKNIKLFICDEVDQLIGCEAMHRGVQAIFAAMPQNKQVLLFSATLPKELRPLCKRFTHNSIEIYVDDDTKLTSHGLQQFYIKLDEKVKYIKLFDLLDHLDFNQVVIFVNSIERCITLNKLLNSQVFPSVEIYAGMSQDERIDRYKQFKDFEKRILVATDLFGRGIDIENVNIVINYDMPYSGDAYLHRVARAGRFGTKGLAITFIANAKEEVILNQVQDRFEKIAELPAETDVSSYIESYQGAGDQKTL